MLLILFTSRRDLDTAFNVLLTFSWRWLELEF
jgi:hypothetical protein